jgi:hypothetical protein
MAVSHLASSESHTGTAGSVSQASFTWNHTPGGTARGVTVFVCTNGNVGVTLATSVTYDGVTVPAVSGGEASRTVGESGNMKAFHLGSGIPVTSPAAVVVNRTNNAVEMYAVCVTQAANVDTEVYTAGIVLTSGAGAALSERSPDDGSPGTNSLRYAGGHYGYDSVPTTGANSTSVQNLDSGLTTAAVVVETTAGQGARLVGFTEAAADEMAIVHLAVREVIGGIVHLASSESHPGTTGSTFEASFTWNHTPGAPPTGVTVCVWTNGNLGVTLATSVTYGGVTVPAIPGAEASRTVGEQGNMKVFHLGVSVPATSPAAVVVNRTNNAVAMYAVCFTQYGTRDTQLYESTIVLRQGASGVVEELINDGSPGSNSLRYAAGHFGNDNVPTVGPNSVALQSIDMGSTTALAVKEITGGQGSRLVGMEDATADEKAIVHFAIREIFNIGADLSVFVYGLLFPGSPIGPVPGQAIQFSSAEALHVGQEYSVLRVGLGDLMFTASPNHAQVTDYKAQLRAFGNSTVLLPTLSLGVPTPDIFDHIVVNLNALYSGRAAGDYTVSILTETPTGSVDSEESNAFTLPLI